MIILQSPYPAIAFDFATITGKKLLVDGDSVLASGVSVGGAIATAPDQSGSGNNATQATGIKQPLLQQVNTGSKTLNVLRFDGSNDFLATTSIAHGIGTGDFTFAAVIKLTTESSYRAIGGNGNDTPTLFLYSDATHFGQPSLYIAGDHFALVDMTTTAFKLLLAVRSGGTLRYYINGVQAATTFSLSNSVPTAVHLVGSETAAGASYFLGDIAFYLFAASALTGSVLTDFQAYAISRFGLLSQHNFRQVIFEGDSRTNDPTYPTAVNTGLGVGYLQRWRRVGVSGYTTAQMITHAPTVVDPLFETPIQNYVVIWGGQNDWPGAPSAQDVYDNIVAYVAARRAAGVTKVVVCTETPRAGNPTVETKRQTFNTNLRANWATFADALADFGADPVMGPQAAASDTNLYVDGLHPTALGYANLAVIVKDAILTLP